MSLNERRAEFVYDSARLAAISALAPIVPEPWSHREELYVRAAAALKNIRGRPATRAAGTTQPGGKQ